MSAPSLPPSAPPAVTATRVVQRQWPPAEFPDPASGGQLPKVSLQQLGVSSPQFQATRRACQHLLPTGESLQQQEAKCAENGRLCTRPAAAVAERRAEAR